MPFPAHCHAPGVIGSSGLAPMLDAFTGAVQATSTDPWTGIDHALGATADYALVLVSWETAHTMAVTFGGVAMNAGALIAADGTLTKVQAFWLDAASLPAAGTISVVGDPSGATAGYVGIWTLIGAASGVPSRTDDAVANTGTSVAPTLASVPAGAFIASGSNHNGTIAVTLTGGTTRFSDATATGGQRGAFGDSAIAGTTSVTHTYTGSGSERRSGLMVEILRAP